MAMRRRAPGRSSSAVVVGLCATVLATILATILACGRPAGTEEAATQSDETAESNETGESTGEPVPEWVPAACSDPEGNMEGCSAAFAELCEAQTDAAACEAYSLTDEDVPTLASPYALQCRFEPEMQVVDISSPDACGEPSTRSHCFAWRSNGGAFNPGCGDALVCVDGSPDSQFWHGRVTDTELWVLEYGCGAGPIDFDDCVFGDGPAACACACG